MEDIEFLYSKFLLSDGVSIDTRTIEKGNLFFALSGQNFNANQFADQALDNGASFVVVDDEKYATSDRAILVDDVLLSLQNLAKHHRSMFKGPVLAITGSNGKTTTKELIFGVLSERHVVHATRGNYNNHIGVPLTLLQIHSKVDIAIIEMGANHVGEIAFLCEIATPTHGLITNIGHAHTEGFGGFEGVIRGKSELFDFLRKSEGQVLINTNDPVLAKMSKKFKEPIYYPENDVELIQTTPILELKLSNQSVSTQLVGSYNFENIAAAIAVGRLFEVTDNQIASSIRSYIPNNARSQIIKKGSTKIILDAYNANPDSMKASLDSLAEMKGNKLAILGDMNELQDSEKEHRDIVEYAKKLNLAVITVGEKMGVITDSDFHFNEKQDLISYLDSNKFPDSIVLLKASRSIKLETVVENIQP
jgi:UDP-N-acetylmuramoyl-tripeptide--D-alanyl-D-alanine ligase